MKKRVVIDGIVFSLQRVGGISVYFHSLLDFLTENQVPTTLLLEVPLLQQIEELDHTIFTLRRKARLLERYRPCRIPENASVFHSSYYRLPNRSNVPTVVTVYDFIYERYEQGARQWVHTKQKNAAIRSAQAVICISESTKLDLLEFVGETSGQNIYVIHLGVSEVFRKLSLGSSIVPYVLFVGQRAGYKNFKQLLEAMEFLPDLELFCVGGGTFRPDELSGMPESVVRRVKHLGLVRDEELNVLYNQAVCLVYPSSYEGFGIPVVEAMRAGCPVVCTDCKAVLEVGQDAVTAVPDSDPRSMSDAVLKTLSSERSILIQKGLSVAKGYSWETTHLQTIDVYRSLGAYAELAN